MTAAAATSPDVPATTPRKPATPAVGKTAPPGETTEPTVFEPSAVEEFPTVMKTIPTSSVEPSVEGWTVVTIIPRVIISVIRPIIAIPRGAIPITVVTVIGATC